MNKKLTLSVDETAIKAGKEYALKTNQSLSQMVETFLMTLGEGNGSKDAELVPISPKLMSLVGIGSGDFTEDDYKRHLELKHA